MDAKSLLIGITIGLGLYGVQTTRKKVVLPAVHAVQHTVRPIPQDAEEKRQKKQAKLEKKRRKAAEEKAAKAKR